MSEHNAAEYEPKKTRFKKRNESNSSQWDQISLWQLNAIKIHAHSLQSTDRILTKCGYGFTYCACGDKIIGFGKGYRIRHNPLSNSIYKSLGISGDYPHLATNMTNEVVGCSYGDNRIMHYTVDENDNESTTTIIPINSETKYIGAQYVNGLWVLISETNVYYTKDVTKGFNSIKYTSSGDSTIRYLDTCVCKYGDYYYIIGIGYQGSVLRIQINAGNLSLTKVDYTTVNDFSYCIAIIPATTNDGIGTSPVIVTAGANHYMMVYHGDSPLELTDFNGVTTSVYCSRSVDKGSGTGFECGKRKISLIYNCSNGASVGNLIFDLDTNETYLLGELNTKYGGNPKIFGFDCGTHYAAYTWYSNDTSKYYCDTFSSYNGITWQRNWGYLYMENADRTHNIITSVMEKLNNDSTLYASGLYIGTGIYTSTITRHNTTYPGSFTMNIPVDFKPTTLLMSCYSKLDDDVEYKEKTLTFEDRNGEIWKLTSSALAENHNSLEIDSILSWGFYGNSVYNSISSEVGATALNIGTCEWDGKNLNVTLTSSYDATINYLNKKNYIYNWEAFS